MCTNPLYMVTSITYLNKKGKLNKWFFPSKKEAEVKANVINGFYQVLNCGNCTECRIQRSKEWAERCMAESKQTEIEKGNRDYMVTLTYDNENLPLNKYNEPTLRKKEVQDFIKRLRKIKKFRYYMCGEYGDKYKRPHYHIILFNIKLEDLKFHSIRIKNGQKNKLYTSELLTKKWGKGRVIINENNYNTSAYIARYVMKKWKGDNGEHYKNLDIEPEYNTMSRNPGIGQKFYIENKEKILKNQKLFYTAKGKIKTFTIPRYIKKLLKKDNEYKFLKWQSKKRDIANEIQKISKIDNDTKRELRELRLKNFKTKREY